MLLFIKSYADALRVVISVATMIFMIFGPLALLIYRFAKWANLDYKAQDYIRMRYRNMLILTIAIMFFYYPIVVALINIGFFDMIAGVSQK